MANTTIIFGVVFIILGIVGYVATGMVSPTALIPAGFGAIFCVLGIVARDPGKRKHSMHAAALLGLLAVLGSGRGLTKLIPLLTGEPVDRPSAVIAQSTMAVLGIIFVAICIKSFKDARRGRAAA